MGTNTSIRPCWDTFDATLYAVGYDMKDVAMKRGKEIMAENKLSSTSKAAVDALTSTKFRIPSVSMLNLMGIPQVSVPSVTRFNFIPGATTYKQWYNRPLECSSMDPQEYFTKCIVRSTPKQKVDEYERELEDGIGNSVYFRKTPSLKVLRCVCPPVTAGDAFIMWFLVSQRICLPAACKGLLKTQMEGEYESAAQRIVSWVREHKASSYVYLQRIADLRQGATKMRRGLVFLLRMGAGWVLAEDLINSFSTYLQGPEPNWQDFADFMYGEEGIDLSYISFIPRGRQVSNAQFVRLLDDAEYKKLKSLILMTPEQKWIYDMLIKRVEIAELSVGVVKPLKKTHPASIRNKNAKALRIFACSPSSFPSGGKRRGTTTHQLLNPRKKIKVQTVSIKSPEFAKDSKFPSYNALAVLQGDEMNPVKNFENRLETFDIVAVSEGAEERKKVAVNENMFIVNADPGAGIKLCGFLFRV